MWRAIVLGSAVYLVLQLFTPAPVSAVDSEGYWKWLGVDFADFNQDCIIDLMDMQLILWRYGSSFGLPPPWDQYYDQRYDVEPDASDGIEGNNEDWDIDIKDIQYVFGRNWLNCLDSWDPNLSMGEYSYKAETPTGPGTACTDTAKSPPERCSSTMPPYRGWSRSYLTTDFPPLSTTMNNGPGKSANAPSRMWTPAKTKEVAIPQVTRSGAPSLTCGSECTCVLK